MAESITKVLGAMQGQWDKSQAAYDTMFGGLKIPANTYDAKLTHCNVKVSQQGNPMINREFTIINSSEFDGSKVFDRIMLGTEQGPTYVRRFIDQCGYEQPKKATELEKLLAKIDAEGLEFQIKVVHNGDFVNVTILKPLGEVEPGEEGGDAEPADGEPAADGADGEPAAAEGTDGGSDEDEELRVAAITYARTQDIALEDDTPMEEILTEMARYEYKEEHATPDEIELLEKLGLQDSIVRKPAPKPTAGKAAPKPAAAAAKPAGKPAAPTSAKKPAAPAAGKKPLPGKKK